MALVMLVRRRPLEVPTAQVAVPDDGFDTHVANAQRLAQAMKFEQALPQWRAAAKLRPQDQQVLSAWFKTASPHCCARAKRRERRAMSSGCKRAPGLALSK